MSLSLRGAVSDDRGSVIGLSSEAMGGTKSMYVRLRHNELIDFDPYIVVGSG
ncbi:hypothetical protein ACFPFU_24550 [Negadavirga shengliensis]|uniref:Uncharacterized protein n=1 Tax=Negadavirga shengliensis TaxID=1389218 RepID=A0ABV9T831_9BACT